MKDLLVLCYHGVSPTWDSPYSVTPTRLAAQVQDLLRRGYLARTLTDALADDAAPRLAVTFDDALPSVLDHALPVLQRLGVPATVFACTAWVGRPEPMQIGYFGAAKHELVSLGWDDLHVLSQAGWEVGSHTRSHPRLTELEPARLATELSGSKADVEEALGAPCRALAYPHGAYDSRVMMAAAAAGYESACTGQAGVTVASPFQVPRVVVLREDGRSRMRLKTSRAARRARASRAWGALAPAYARFGGRGHRGAA